MSAIREAPSGCVDTVERVGELYAAQATRLRRLVCLQVNASDAVIEDACQVAWLRLVVHRRRVRREGALAWLVRVAAHEVIRVVARGERDVPLHAALEEELAMTAPPLVEELAAHRSRLHAIGGLTERQQRLVWMRSLGFSYVEIAGRTGESRRTVERQLLRARRRLADGEFLSA